MTRKSLFPVLAWSVLLWLPMAPAVDVARGDELASALSVLRQAPETAQSQASLAAAWKRASLAAPAELPEILAAMQDVGPLAENWLRSAADAVAERQLATAEGLPEQLLQAFVLDRNQPPRGRRVAFEWLERADAAAAEELLAKMLDDPSWDLRYDAVARFVKRAEAGDDAERQKQMYQQAFAAARDVKQIEEIAEALRGLGEKPNMARQMGFVTHWHVVGPFDNVGLNGFGEMYEPETALDLSATYQGKSGPVRWEAHVTDEPRGLVDLNTVLTDDKEVTAYAAAEINSPSQQSVQIRLASKNAPQAWLNGEKIGAFEVYHAGYAIDQYVMPVQLQKGPNTILLKLSQNAKTKPWQKEWDFRLRVTDALGGAVDYEQRQVDAR